jgi:hypothetical protein
MKSKILLLAALLVSVAQAAPSVEVIKSVNIAPVFVDWLHHNANAVAGHRAFRIYEKIDKTPIISGDVLLLEKYSATPIVYEGNTLTKPVVAGDYYTFLWDEKPRLSGQGKETCRVVGSITATGIKTTSGTVIPFAHVTGIVRRILRVTDTAVNVNIPVSNVIIK